MESRKRCYLAYVEKRWSFVSARSHHQELERTAVAKVLNAVPERCFTELMVAGTFIAGN